MIMDRPVFASDRINLGGYKAKVLGTQKILIQERLD